MIVHMTGLYTILVTYARLYILRLVVFFYHDISYISFITLFLILIILLSFISVIILLLFTFFLYMSTFLFTHTLIRSLLTTLDSHVQDFFDNFLYCLGVRVIVRFVRSWSFFLFDSGILTSFYSCFCTFLDSCILESVFIQFFFAWYHTWMLICHIAVILIYQSRFYYLFRLL